MILEPLGGGRSGGWLSALCRREKGFCGLDFRLGLESEPRAVPDGATGSNAQGPDLLSGNLALVGSDGNTNRESLAENDLAVLTPER